MDSLSQSLPPTKETTVLGGEKNTLGHAYQGKEPDIYVFGPESASDQSPALQYWAYSIAITVF